MAFWTGVVEDRNDPEQLGRCRVRIFGHHTGDTTSLSTQDLPWAIPLQSITSAAISGVGSTPVGIVPGSWVMGFFLDGQDAQKPIILGTVAGKPAANPLVQQAQQQQELAKDLNVVTDGQGNIVRDGSGQPIKTTQFEDPLDNFGNLVKGDVNKLITGIGNFASANNYSKEENGKLGKYQFSYVQLVILGYAYRQIDTNSETELSAELDPTNLDNPKFWTGKGGVYSKQDFLDKQSVQDTAMIEMSTYNYKNLVRLGKINKETEPGIVAGLLASAHIGGYSNSDKLGRRTGDKLLRDAFLIGAEAVSGQDTEYNQALADRGSFFSTSIDGPGLTSEELSNLVGFQDPNKDFPRQEYSNHNDLNKLALGEKGHRLFNIKENQRETDIPKARSTETWEEPKPVFGAEYPYNQVLETEAGHVVELDSTPGAERIHVFHKKGTYLEIDINGSMVRKVVGDNYEIIDKNNYVFVKGAESITIEGKTRILVKDQAFLEVEGGLSITSNKDMVIQTAKDMALIANRFELSSETGIDLKSKGPVNIQGSSVNVSATDGSIINAATKSIFNTAGEQINNISGTETRLQAGNQFDIKSGTNTNIDAGGQFNIRMGQAQAAPEKNTTDLTIRATPEEKTPTSVEPKPLARDITGPISFFGDDDPNSVSGKSEEMAENGLISNEVDPPKTSDTQKFGRSNSIPKNPANCSEFTDIESFGNSIKNYPIGKKTPMYVVGDFIRPSAKWVFKSQVGLPLSKITCNLSNIARNVMEPIRDRYPWVTIASGFRNVTRRFPNEASDHLRGCAVDLQFSPTRIEDVRDIAVWMQANIPYKQLLLEYEADANNKVFKVWIHISLELSSSGSIVPSSRTPVATFLNHKMKYENQLVNLA